MLNKILLSIVLFQLLITVIMAETCSIYFDSTLSTHDGPYPVTAGICYPHNPHYPVARVFHAWIDTASPGGGYLAFFSDRDCMNVITEGTSPIDLNNLNTGFIIHSYAVTRCT